MPQLTRSSFRNRLFAALPADDVRLLQAQAEPVALNVGDVLVQPHQPVEHVYFPEEGLVSVVAITAGGRRIEVGIVGRDGMVGTPILLGTDRSPHENFVQIKGRAWRMRSDDLCQAVGRSPSLHGILLRYVQAFMTQTAHTALSNGSHKLEERLARWLLMCYDRVDGDELPTTHVFLSLMLGANRPGVTLAIRTLEKAGIIRTRRGRITVLDRARLEDAAADSYGIPEEEYGRIIGPLR